MQWVECITICLEEEISALAIAIVMLGQILPFTSQQYCIANLIYKAHDHLRFIRVRNINWLTYTKICINENYPLYGIASRF